MAPFAWLCWPLLVLRGGRTLTFVPIRRKLFCSIFNAWSCACRVMTWSSESFTAPPQSLEFSCHSHVALPSVIRAALLSGLGLLFKWAFSFAQKFKSSNVQKNEIHPCLMVSAWKNIPKHYTSAVIMYSILQGPFSEWFLPFFPQVHAEFPFTAWKRTLDVSLGIPHCEIWKKPEQWLQAKPQEGLRDLIWT